MSIVAVLDACVLFPYPLCSLLMWLLEGKAYRGHWTNEIHDEWTRNVLRENSQLSPQKIAKRREYMDRNNRGALITDYEHLIPTITLPDPDDRHVVAAAIKAEANFIVTFNLGDFPASVLIPYGIQAIHPDDFVLSLIDRDLQKCLDAVRIHRSSLKNPPKTPKDYLETLKKQGLDKSVTRMADWDF